MMAAKASTVLLTDVEIDRIERRIRNWVEWLYASDPSLRSGGCCSIESRYRAPRADGEALVASVRLSLVDHVDGELLDRAIVSLPNNAHRAYVQMAYAKQRSEGQIARRLSVPVARMEELHVLVLSALARRLAELERPILIRRGRRLWAGLDGC